MVDFRRSELARDPAPHASALRKCRTDEPGRVYLLTTVVEPRRPVFADWRIGRLLVSELRAEHESGRVNSLAWVVMPDHLHWRCRWKSAPWAH